MLIASWLDVEFVEWDADDDHQVEWRGEVFETTLTPATSRPILLCLASVLKNFAVKSRSNY